MVTHAFGQVPFYTPSQSVSPLVATSVSVRQGGRLTGALRPLLWRMHFHRPISDDPEQCKRMNGPRPLGLLSVDRRLSLVGLRFRRLQWPAALGLVVCRIYSAEGTARTKERDCLNTKAGTSLVWTWS